MQSRFGPGRRLHERSLHRKFAFYDVTLKYDVFDNETFIRNNTRYYATATNVETGKAEYLEMKDVVDDMEKLQQVYELGVKDCHSCMARLKEYLNKDI